jgi:hypothetical protein
LGLLCQRAGERLEGRVNAAIDGRDVIGGEMEAFWAEYAKVLAQCAKPSASVHWTAYLTACLTPMVAVFGVLIAYRQSRIANDKLRLDLFERRLVVYEAVRTVFGELLARGKISPKDETNYLRGIQGAKLLFDSQLNEYLSNTLWRKLVTYAYSDDELRETPHGPVREKLANEREILWKWFRDQMDEVDEKFSPYMGFDHQKRSIAQVFRRRFTKG